MAADEELVREVLADRYAVERCVGSGGSASIFRAEDLKHSRSVAIKVFHPEVAAAIGPARFLREIATAASLNHPNILPLHDSGEIGGLLYYVMPFVEGESLRELLNRERQLTLDTALKFATEVGEALEYAHREGVVHRDIKPENILLSHDHALVADFGIARAIGSLGTQRLTAPTALLGTPAYMSPEQWDGGEGHVDGRSDIYGLACVVYEMLGGQPPFTGVTAESLAHQHMSLEPRLVSDLRTAVPEPVARVLHRALAKSPADRPQSAAEFVRELRKAASSDAGAGKKQPVRFPWPAAGVAAGVLIVAVGLLWWKNRPSPEGSSAHSIAVLPLKDLSGVSQQSYFADGMTDELITCLAKISSLTVISNSATSTYRNSSKPLARIARELGVRYVLEGSVARATARLRIATRLIEAHSGRALWAESYERDLGDFISLQSDVALAVAERIRVRLTANERTTISTPRKVDPEAHDLYLKARFSTDSGTREGVQRSVQLLKQALQRDPNYALAYAGLSNTYYLMSGWFLPADEAMPLARDHAAKALAIDSTLSEGLTIHGIVTYFYDWEFDVGLAQLRRAVENNPGSATARQWYAYTLNIAGRFDESRAEYAYARKLDPVSEQLQWLATWPWYYERKFDKAIEQLNHARTQNPAYWPTYSLQGETLESLGKLSESLSMLERARDLGGNPWVVAAIARVEAKAGRRAEALETLRGLEAARDTAYIQPYALATIYATLGQTDHAFEELEVSLRERSEDLLMLGIDPRMDPLRSDPRFAALLRRIRDGARSRIPPAVTREPYPHPVQPVKKEKSG